MDGDTVPDYGYHLITADKGWFDNNELRILLDANGIVEDMVLRSSKRYRKNGGDDSAIGL